VLSCARVERGPIRVNAHVFYSKSTGHGARACEGLSKTHGNEYS
jgi:hypothetical protein